MVDKLIVDDTYGPIRLTWWIEEDSDFGASVGDGYKPKETEPSREKDEEKWRWWVAERVALPFADLERGYSGGFEFESVAKARAALAAIKMAWSAKRPMNEHEKWCLSQGWKPPKGWTGAT